MVASGKARPMAGLPARLSLSPTAVFVLKRTSKSFLLPVEIALSARGSRLISRRATVFTSRAKLLVAVGLKRSVTLPYTGMAVCEGGLKMPPNEYCEQLLYQPGSRSCHIPGRALLSRPASLGPARRRFGEAGLVVAGAKTHFIELSFIS